MPGTGESNNINDMLKQLTNSDPKPTHEEIAALAYSIFEKNGKIPGRDAENWLQSEAQLVASRKSPAPSNSNARGAAKASPRPVLNHRA